MSRKYVHWTRHAKVRLFFRLRKNNIYISMYHAMRQIGRIAARYLNVKNGTPKLYNNVKWEYGTFKLVLVDNQIKNWRYIVTVIF